jgi:hypothetical protein
MCSYAYKYLHRTNTAHDTLTNLVYEEHRCMRRSRGGEQLGNTVLTVPINSSNKLRGIYTEQQRAQSLGGGAG